jgi:hypothetical protein
VKKDSSEPSQKGLKQNQQRGVDAGSSTWKEPSHEGGPDTGEVMKTNDSGRTTAFAWGSRSAAAENGADNKADNKVDNKAGITESASTAYAMYYVDAAPELRRTTDPAIHLRQRALLAPAGRRQRERVLLDLVVAQWVAQRREQAAQLSTAALHAADRDEAEAEAYSPQFRDPRLHD